MSARAKFVIQPFKFKARAPTRTELRKEAVFHEALKLIARHQASNVAFEDVYRTAYNMVLKGRFLEARKMTDPILHKLSLMRGEKSYYTVAKLYHDLLMYGERTWARNFKHPFLLDEAKRLYERPVARRWRRAWNYLRWVGRIRAWVLCFNEYAFMDNSIGAQRCAENFYSHAAGMSA